MLALDKGEQEMYVDFLSASMVVNFVVVWGGDRLAVAVVNIVVDLPSADFVVQVLFAHWRHRRGLPALSSLMWSSRR